MDAAADPNSEILARLGRGDVRGAAHMLVSQHADEVYALCRAIVRDPIAAEDLSQDVFGRAFAALPTFRGESSVRTWVLKIARHRAFDHLRARQRRPWERAGDDEPDAQPTEEPSLADLFARREELATALEALEEGERALVVLRFGHGLGYAELAEAFGLREGTVRMRISRAVARMRDAIEPEATRAKARSRGEAPAAGRARERDRGQIDDLAHAQRDGALDRRADLAEDDLAEDDLAEDDLEENAESEAQRAPEAPPAPAPRQEGAAFPPAGAPLPQRPRRAVAPARPSSPAPAGMGVGGPPRSGGAPGAPPPPPAAAPAPAIPGGPPLGAPHRAPSPRSAPPSSLGAPPAPPPPSSLGAPPAHGSAERGAKGGVLRRLRAFLGGGAGASDAAPPPRTPLTEDAPLSLRAALDRLIDTL